MGDERDFASLTAYLERVPAVGFIAPGRAEDGTWWVKFTIDIDHHLSWKVVQEFAYVLNNLSLNERLPTVFMPVSPPPYLNGGPREFLDWVIECRTSDFKPGTCVKWLEGRLPRPVGDETAWRSHDDEVDDT